MITSALLSAAEQYDGPRMVLQRNVTMPHANERNLKHAPITEAVIDLRVKARGDFVSYIPALRTAFLESFGTVEEQAGDQIGPHGLIFPKTPQSEAVQTSESGFAFSKLRPYTSWEDVLDSARRYWAVYRQVVNVEVVSRIGVRYINQFHVRSDEGLGEYLTSPPQVPETVAGLEVTNTLSRFVLKSDAAVSARALYSTRADDSGKLVIIDVDASKLGDFDPDTFGMWQTLEELRRMKNRIFFGSITERAAEEFDR